MTATVALAGQVGVLPACAALGMPRARASQARPGSGPMRARDGPRASP